ncbi:MAG: S9 family peptidase, partial [Stackebrandtia sp.]
MSPGSRNLPYGTWPSPISPSDVVRGDAAREWPGHFGNGICWVEACATEDGRAALMWSGQDGEPLPGWHVKSRAIEYGGRPWARVSGAAADGLILVNGGDQRVYHWKPGAEPLPLTPVAAAGSEYRFCDFEVHAGRVWSLRETVSDPRGRDVKRHIVTFPLDGTAADQPEAVVERADSHHFMSGPKLSPDGGQVAWIGWDHPDMP